MSVDVQSHLDQMDQQALMGEKGYQIFSRMYALTNPRPEPIEYQSRNGWTRYAIGGVMVASSIVSANHTIPTFAGDDKQGIALAFGIIAGIAAFFMSEMALATFAYYGVLRHYRAHGTEPKSIQYLVLGGVFIPLIVMASANIFHEFKINGLYIAPLIETFITLAISLSAPIMGYVSGEIFAALEVNDRIDAAKHLLDEQEKQERYQEKCRQAWGRSKGDYGGRIRVESMPTPQLSAVSSGQDRTGQDRGHGTGAGYTKQSEAREFVKEHLRLNPEDLGLTVRALADKIGQSKTTVGDVMKEMRNQDA